MEGRIELPIAVFATLASNARQQLRYACEVQFGLLITAASSHAAG